MPAGCLLCLLLQFRQARSQDMDLFPFEKRIFDDEFCLDIIKRTIYCELSSNLSEHTLFIYQEKVRLSFYDFNKLVGLLLGITKPHNKY